jgi:cyclin-dependent kinase
MSARYIKQGYAGSSIYADVFRAIDTLSDNRVVALKTTLPDELRPPHDALKEAALLRSFLVDRPAHVTELLDDWIEDDGLDQQLTIVLPFYEVDLRTLLKQHRGPDCANTLPIARADRIMRELADALCFLHDRGVIHRDIKPTNLMFTGAGTAANSQLKLIDFDIAWVAPDNYGKEPGDQKITDVGSGTYRAPELLFGIDNYGDRLDMWAVGCIACQLYAAESPASAVSPFHNDNSKSSDIALIGTIFETLGAPTTETWPEVAAIESFQHMQFRVDPARKRSFEQLAPRATAVMHTQVLPRLLCCSESARLTAAELLELMKTVE